MKRILLPAALVLALSGCFAMAQEPAAPTQPPAPVERHHAPDPHKAAMRLSKQLNLTSDQTAKLEPIFADRDQKIAAIPADAAPKDRHKQMHAIQKDTEQQLSGVLNPEQLDQMKSMKHDHHGPEAQPLPAPPAS